MTGRDRLKFFACVLWGLVAAALFLVVLVTGRTDPYLWIWLAMLVIPVVVGAAAIIGRRR